MKTILSYTTHNYNDKQVTGGILRFQELIEGLARKGHKINLISPTEDYFNENENIDNFKFTEYKIRTTLIPNNLINFILNFWFFIKRITFANNDISIAFDLPNASILTFFGAKNLNLFIRQDILAYRENYYNNLFIRKIYFFILTLLESLIFLKSKKIFVQCKHDKNILLNRHKLIKNLISNRLIIINNNLNVSWIEKNKKLIKKRISKTDDCLKIIFVGSISKRKGIDILLESFEKLNKNYNIYLTIIGDGNLELINDYLDEYSNINYLGFVSNPLKEVIKNDLVVVPSREDSFPNTIMEPMYLEVPVIGAKSGGIPEQLYYEELLFNLTVENLHKKLKNIIDEKNLEKIRKLVIKRKGNFLFDWVSEIENEL